ncbi:MAG: HAMP domain-containing histidine kinase, partial [Candidatus Omnitrophica bacterium]|nr:HAMP domain-containing histidine kinase [Candidatus Omnitrophota bacterium]
FSLGDGQDFVLQIATSQKSALALLEERRNVLLISMPLILIIAIIIGRYFSNQLIKPLTNVATTAEHISHKDLAERITTDYKDEEINILINAFNNMLTRLERSFGHITDFNSHVSHELKTPIAIISGECEVALRKNQSNEEYRETLVAVYDEAQKMLKITEDLLLLAKLDYNQGVFKFEEFMLHKFFSNIQQSIEKANLAKDHVFKMEMPEKEVFLNGDPVHLRRLFMNIINNAIKFTPKGGCINISVLLKERNLVVKINDTGAGIREEDILNIFNQFYQKTPVTLRLAQGNGLGLSIAQSIAKIHRGVITVESTVGSGSTFTVTLPIISVAIDLPQLTASQV